MATNNQEENLSIINENVSIEGNILGKESNLLIRGNVKGDIKAKKITIAKEGKVFADIETETILINGQFEGSIKADNLFKILSEGSCSGKVICRQISIEEGGVVNSEVRVVEKGDIIEKSNQLNKITASPKPDANVTKSNI